MLEQKFINSDSVYEVSSQDASLLLRKNILKYKYAISDLLNNLILKRN